MKLTQGQPMPRRSDSPGPQRNPPAGPTPPAKMPPRRVWLWFLLILAMNYLLMHSLFPSADDPVKVPYTLFKEQVMSKNVAAIYSRGETILGRFDQAVTYPPPSTKAENGKPVRSLTNKGLPAREPRDVNNFTTTLPAFVDPGLEELLIDH